MDHYVTGIGDSTASVRLGAELRVRAASAGAAVLDLAPPAGRARGPLLPALRRAELGQRHVLRARAVRLPGRRVRARRDRQGCRGSPATGQDMDFHGTNHRRPARAARRRLGVVRRRATRRCRTPTRRWCAVPVAAGRCPVRHRGVPVRLRSERHPVRVLREHRRQAAYIDGLRYAVRRRPRGGHAARRSSFVKALGYQTEHPGHGTRSRRRRPSSSA